MSDLEAGRAAGLAIGLHVLTGHGASQVEAVNVERRKMREFLLGGATRHILANATLPVAIRRGQDGPMSSTYRDLQRAESSGIC